jgi:isopentenyl-diphosphate delta-isomerase
MKVDNNLIALVDENDLVTGYEDKMLVHKEGLLHRAFSIFVLNSKNEIMLQQRAFEKYHSGGLWTNTCCSHMVLGEKFEITIHKRLFEEMGFDCALERVHSFRYQTHFQNGLIENELDHIYLGRFNNIPNVNPAEVCNWKWMDIDQIAVDLEQNEEKYTYWFKIAFQHLLQNNLLHSFVTAD